MENPITLANWRTAPFNLHSFQGVDALIPVSRIAGAQQASRLESEPRSLDKIVFEDHQGRERHLTEVLATTSNQGLVVLQGGRIVAEQYGLGYDGSRPHILFSVSKSLTAALAGILVDRGQLDPDSRVTNYIPEVANSAYGDCTVRHVLDMTVSSSFSEEYLDTTGEFSRYRRATLWNPSTPGEPVGTLHGFLETLSRAPGPHGEIFHYLSPNSDFLGWLLERVSGQDFTTLFSELIWKPIGAEAEAYVTVDSAGSPRTAGGICALPRDLARFGDMMRQGGQCQGVDVVPGWWVDDIRSGGDSGPWKKSDMVEVFPDGRYRSKWYQSGYASGAFCGIGIHGQMLWIDPEREVVIAYVSAQPDPVSRDFEILLAYAFEAIAKAL